MPGSKYQFTFDGSPGDSLSFVSMLAATNDVFLAPKDVGIPLFDANGVALTGDISDRVFLWDAGTEGNEKPAHRPEHGHQSTGRQHRHARRRQSPALERGFNRHLRVPVGAIDPQGDDLDEVRQVTIFLG